MSSTWQEPTVTELVPSKIMRQNEARAMKTRTRISRRGSVYFRISRDFPGTTNTADVKGQTPMRDWLICEPKITFLVTFGKLL